MSGIVQTFFNSSLFYAFLFVLWINLTSLILFMSWNCLLRLTLTTTPLTASFIIQLYLISDNDICFIFFTISTSILQSSPVPIHYLTCYPFDFPDSS